MGCAKHFPYIPIHNLALQTIFPLSGLSHLELPECVGLSLDTEPLHMLFTLILHPLFA